MADDIIFCAKTGQQVVKNASGSNVIPFPRRATDKPKPVSPKSYAERVTIRSSGTFEDIDNVTRDEIAALAERFQESDDI